MKDGTKKTREQSEETRAVSLLTTDRAYSDPNTKEVRKTLVPVITNPKLAGTDLICAVLWCDVM